MPAPGREHQLGTAGLHYRDRSKSRLRDRPLYSGFDSLQKLRQMTADCLHRYNTIDRTNPWGEPRLLNAV
jgi:hypothetical protein